MVIRAGVVGHPVAHSLSPRLFAYWLRKHGIDGRYDAIPCEPGRFVETLAALKAEGLAGINVTLPFKAEALAHAQVTTPLARRLGAANTLTFADGLIHADNTDAEGFAEALRPHLTEAHRTALVLGAGGAAPAILAGLKALGIAKVGLANRTPEKAEALAERFGARVLPWEERGAVPADLLVNATSLGLPGGPPLDVALDALPPHALVFDTVYGREETPLVRDARGRGLSATDGLAMLVRQAVPGFARWFGATPTDLEGAERHLRAAP
jgi:shikimate dehydrogenase